MSIREASKCAAYLGLPLRTVFYPHFLRPNAARLCCRTGAKRRRESRRCKELLEKLKHEQEDAMRHSRYPAASCPICFDDLAGAEELKNSASTGDAGGGT